MSAKLKLKIDLILDNLQLCDTKQEIETFLNAQLLELANEYVNQNTFIKYLGKLINCVIDFASVYEPWENESLKSEYSGHLQYHGISYLRNFKTRADVFKLNTGDTEIEIDSEIEENDTTPKTIDFSEYLPLIVKLLSSNNWYEIGLGIAASTGRRITESYLTGEFNLCDNEYTINFRGVLKKRDDHTSWYKIVTLVPAKTVFEAWQKMVKIRNQKLNVLTKTGNITKLESLFDFPTDDKFYTNVAARFNKNHSSSYGPVFDKSGLRNFISVSNQKTSKDRVHSLRAIYAVSVAQYFVDFGLSIGRSLEKTQKILIHDDLNTTERYLREFKIVNTPNFDVKKIKFGEVVGKELESILNTVEPVTVVEPVVVEPVTVVEPVVVEPVVVEPEVESIEIQVLKNLPVQNHSIFGELLQTHHDLTGVLNFLINQYRSKQQIEKTTIPTNRLIISRLIDAIFEYNNTVIDKNLGVAVTGAFVNKLAVMCGLKQFENKLLQDVLSGLSLEIENNIVTNRLNLPKRLNEYSNTHIRGDAIIGVLRNISRIYDAMQL
jgi:hypothetical protein